MIRKNTKSQKVPVARRDSSVGGAHSDNMTCMAGNVTPSANPDRILVTISRKKLVLAAMGINRVNTDVKRIPQPKMRFPP